MPATGMDVLFKQWEKIAKAQGIMLPGIRQQTVSLPSKVYAEQNCFCRKILQMLHLSAIGILQVQ